MHRIPVYVGLDYHKDCIQVCVVNQRGHLLCNRSSKNDWHSVVELAEGYGKVVRASVESCVGAADLAEELVKKAKWSVDLAHPGYVKRMKQNPDKSDFTDAHMLADLERLGYLPRVWLAPQEIRDLRRLVRYRQQLVNERRNIKLRIGALLREHRTCKGSGRRWGRLWMVWLQAIPGMSEPSQWIIHQHLERLKGLREEIQVVEKRLLVWSEKDAVVQKLLALPGVGFVTAWMLRAEIGRFDRFRSGKQLSRFCGLSPRNASSGARQADAGLIKAGNALLRATIIQAAHRLIRNSPRWSALAYKMERGGKEGSVIAAAVANRWIRWLFHQMRPERDKKTNNNINSNIKRNR